MKALVGSWERRPHRLLAEAATLRSRVEDLQQALQRAHEENDQLRAALATALDQAVTETGEQSAPDGDVTEVFELPDRERVALSRS